MANSFTHQVGGHASTILSSPLSSATLIKPSSTTELSFYTTLGPSLAGGKFTEEWCPGFYGTLQLQGKLNEEGEGLIEPLGQVEGVSIKGKGKAPEQMLVLENLTHRFLRPNILDIKLGTVLYDPKDATVEKQERMKLASLNSTSGELGLRLTGFQVWDSKLKEYVQTSKPFGRSLLPSELLLGLSRFFYPSLPYTSLSHAERSHDPSNPNPSSPLPPNSFPPPLPLELLLPILRTFIRRLDSLVEVLKTLEIRIRGGSLLFIIEGDPNQLRRSLLRAISSSNSNSNPEEDEEEDEEDEESTDEDGNALEKTLIPFEVKMIDFAHTRENDPELGEVGYDEGVVKGVENVREGLRELVRGLERDREREEEEEEGKESGEK